MSSQAVPHHRPLLGILCVLVGMLAISVNDMLIKQLSGAYPLHQLVFIRSSIGIFFSLTLVVVEGGFSILRTKNPLLHATRCLLIVLSNLTFFTALAAVPLANATALFFVAPLLITLLSIPFLGERVGPYRLGAVAVGFLGVLIMLRPWESSEDREVSLIILLLPLAAALTYASVQLLTRRLGAVSKASAMAVYMQFAFILVSLLFYAVAGDGRYAVGLDNPSLEFLLRAWIWPEDGDAYLMLALGLNSGIVAYALSQAYRLGNAATVAPFEYIGLPLAIFWGWLIWGQLPGLSIWVGILFIGGSGLFVFLREGYKTRRRQN